MSQPHETDGRGAGKAKLVATGGAFFAAAGTVVGLLAVGGGSTHPGPARSNGSPTAAVSGFRINGSARDAFYPGMSHPVDVVFSNPNRVPLLVRDVRVSVDPATSRPGCQGSSVLRVVHGLLRAVMVPAGSTRSLSQLGVPSADWPWLAMPDLGADEDQCQGATFTLHYTGSAQSG